jgi:hypothetical protein
MLNTNKTNNYNNKPSSQIGHNLEQLIEQLQITLKEISAVQGTPMSLSEEYRVKSEE